LYEAQVIQKSVQIHAPSVAIVHCVPKKGSHQTLAI